MQFELRHILPKPPERAFELLFSEAYRQASTARSSIQQAIVEEGEKDGKRFTRTKITSTRDLPAPIAKIAGTSRLSYELLETIDAENMRVVWKVVPTKLADKVRAEGSYEIRPGPSDSECERVIKGEVRVEVRFVGGKIEDLIGKEIEAGYDRGTEFARKWLAEQD